MIKVNKDERLSLYYPRSGSSSDQECVHTHTHNNTARLRWNEDGTAAEHLHTMDKTEICPEWGGRSLLFKHRPQQKLPFIYYYTAVQSIYLAGKSVPLWPRVLISDILESLA